LKTSLKLLATIVLLSLHAYGQGGFTNGGFRVKFPSEDWSQETPPDVVREPITKGGGQMVLYAESSTGRFFVSKFDYPRIGNQTAFVSGFLRGVRNSTKKAGAEIEEHFGNFRDTQLPTYTFDRKIQDNFVHSEAVFCADRLYNIQIVGPQSQRDELLKALEGVVIKEAPMPRAAFDKAAKGDSRDGSAAYEMGRKFGTVIGMLAVIAVIFVIAKAISAMAGGGKKRPPPLPPSARSVPPPPPAA
jgi:hypothetical protein